MDGNKVDSYDIYDTLTLTTDLEPLIKDIPWKHRLVNLDPFE